MTAKEKQKALCSVLTYYSLSHSLHPGQSGDGGGGFFVTGRTVKTSNAKFIKPFTRFTSHTSHLLSSALNFSRCGSQPSPPVSITPAR